MPSAITICSNALLQLGDEPIASFSEDSKRARLCSNLWPQVRDQFMRKHVWTCLRTRIILSPESEEPPFDWGYSFLLPADCMRVMQVGFRGEMLGHEQAGRRIYADRNTLQLVYIKRIDDPTQWDACMADAAGAEMVARLAYPVTQSASLAQLKRDEADKALRFAKSVASQDNPPEEWGDSPFIAVRG